MQLPSCPDITCAVFLERLSGEFEAVQKECDSKVVYPQEGRTMSVFYLERIVDGKTLRRHFEAGSQSDLVSATVVRSVCEGLGIEASIFGFKWVDEPL
jgi:hypothetical protein